jgi:acetyl esterase
MALEPQVARYLELMAAAPPVESFTPAEARANSERVTATMAGPGPELARVEDVDLDGVPARLYSPVGAGDAVIPVAVWFHGGGWVVGSLDTHDPVCRRLADASGCAVVAVDYRLAPEHRYPAAVEDAWTAVRYVVDHGAGLGLDAGRLVVGGDSAGGNLAAVVGLKARDAGLPLRLQVLVYPVTDHDLETDSYRRNETGFGLTRAAMDWYWNHYCPDPAHRLEPDASPLRALSVAGTAPALVVTCELDPLLDEGEAYARRLEAEGVPVKLSRYPGMVHGFIRLFAVLDRSHDLVAEMAAEIRAAVDAESVAASGPQA